MRNIHQITTYNKDAREYVKNIRKATPNARSIKSKEELITDNLKEYKLDALLITEIWLQNTDEDNIWLQANKFHKDDHKIFNISREDKRGRGIALLYSTKYKIKTVTHTKYNSFENRISNIQSGSTHCILLVYQPLVGTQQGITMSIFIDNLKELLIEVVSNHSNLIMLGDINIHLNELADTDAKASYDILETFNIHNTYSFLPMILAKP